MENTEKQSLSEQLADVFSKKIAKTMEEKNPSANIDEKNKILENAKNVFTFAKKDTNKQNQQNNEQQQNESETNTPSLPEEPLIVKLKVKGKEQEVNLHDKNILEIISKGMAFDENSKILANKEKEFDSLIKEINTDKDTLIFLNKWLNAVRDNDELLDAIDKLLVEHNVEIPEKLSDRKIKMEFESYPEYIREALIELSQYKVNEKIQSLREQAPNADEEVVEKLMKSQADKLINLPVEDQMKILEDLWMESHNRETSKLDNIKQKLSSVKSDSSSPAQSSQSVKDKFNIPKSREELQKAMMNRLKKVI